MNAHPPLGPSSDEIKAPLRLQLSVDQCSYQIVLPNAEHDYIQKKLATDRVPYELEMLEDIRDRVTADSLVLDIGANVGNHTLYLAAVAGCRVESFEPNPQLCAALRESIACNGFAGRVHLHETGLGRAAGTARFGEHKPENLGSQQLALGDGDLSVATLDSFSFDRTVAVIKLDVEGMEIDVLDGAARLLQRDRPLIYVECGTEPHYRRVSRWMSARGYTCWDTFNATPTHLFIPGERLSVEQRLQHLQAKSAQNDYKSVQVLREIRLRMSQALERESNARKSLANAQAQEREARAALADAQAQERDARLALADEQQRRNREVDSLREELEGSKRAAKDLQRAVDERELKLVAARKRATAFAERLANTRESASYQLGQALIAAGRSVKGTLRLPSELARIYRSAKQRQGASSGDALGAGPRDVRERAGGTKAQSDAAAATGSVPASVSLPRPDKVRLVGVPYMSRPLAGVAGHQQVYPGVPLVSVIMTSFNTGQLIEPAVKSILEQTWTNLELIVVDDCSTDDTRDIVERLAATDPRVKLFCFGDNRGTYWCKNFGITQSSGVAVTFMDSDDTSHPSRIELQFEALNRPGCAVSTCNHIRVDTGGATISINGVTERIAFISQMFKRSVIREIGYFDTIRTSADDEILRRIKATYGPESHANVKRVLYTALMRDGSLTRDPENAINFVQPRGESQSFLSPQRRHYAAMVTRWHEFLAEKNLRPYVPFPVVRRPFPVFGKLIVSPGRYDQNMISACIASYPPRRDKLEAVVAALLPQVDHLFVYLNEYEEVPDFLRHSRISVELGGKERNLRDNGKFFFANKVPAGYVLTADDDIAYPADYVETLVRKIEFYDQRAVVGLHGTIFAKPIRNYFRGRTLYHFEHALEHDVVVNQLGTGTVGFHSELLRPDIAEFKSTGMADVWLALACKRLGAPMIAISREANWLQSLGAEEINLFREFRKDDSHQTRLVRSVEPWSEEVEGALGAILATRERKLGAAFGRLLPRPTAAPALAASTEG